MIYDLSNKNSKKALLEHIETLSKLGGKYDVEINEFTGTEKELQKVYFSTIVEPLAEFTGNDRFDVHTQLKITCNPEFEFFEITKAGTTKNISKEKWVNYILRCQDYIISNFGFIVNNRI
jgi:hypothetical protein